MTGQFVTHTLMYPICLFLCSALLFHSQFPSVNQSTTLFASQFSSTNSNLYCSWVIFPRNDLFDEISLKRFGSAVSVQMVHLVRLIEEPRSINEVKNSRQRTTLCEQNFEQTGRRNKPRWCTNAKHSTSLMKALLKILVSSRSASIESLFRSRCLTVQPTVVYRFLDPSKNMESVVDSMRSANIQCIYRLHPCGCSYLCQQ